MANNRKRKWKSQAIASRPIRAKEWSWGFHSNYSEEKQITTIINQWDENRSAEQCRSHKKIITILAHNRRSEKITIRQEWRDKGVQRHHIQMRRYDSRVRKKSRWWS